MRRLLAAAATAIVLLSGCGTRPVVAPAPIAAAPPPEPEPGWRPLAKPGDAALLDQLPARLTVARGAVPRRFARQLAAAGPLVESDTAQPMPQLSPGSYYCRLARFGGAVQFRLYPPDFCYITAEGDALAFTKQTGSTRPKGYVYADGEAARQVFLGTTGTGRYGDGPATDLVGVVERVAPFRWRMMLSRAGRGASFDMYELVPVPAAVPGAQPASQPGS
jgi:hypothetical protein